MKTGMAEDLNNWIKCLEENTHQFIQWFVWISDGFNKWDTLLLLWLLLLLLYLTLLWLILNRKQSVSDIEQDVLSGESVCLISILPIEDILKYRTVKQQV